mmetsp:Transcript_15586/g.39820  ORF Transcript_15586/g.39820 Transcript_15586/m.39820 type:complete len:231 (+) Transcript_15586:868-1560(+)
MCFFEFLLRPCHGVLILGGCLEVRRAPPLFPSDLVRLIISRAGITLGRRSTSTGPCCAAATIRQMRSRVRKVERIVGDGAPARRTTGRHRIIHRDSALSILVVIVSRRRDAIFLSLFRGLLVVVVVVVVFRVSILVLVVVLFFISFARLHLRFIDLCVHLHHLDQRLLGLLFVGRGFCGWRARVLVVIAAVHGKDSNLTHFVVVIIIVVIIILVIVALLVLLVGLCTNLE